MFGVPNIIFPKGTILDQVLEEYRSNPDPPEDQEEIERTLIVCGSDGVGKTTLIQKVTDTSEEVSPTVFIDYSFGVKKGTGESGEVGVCNTWELGSGAVFAPLLYRVPVGGQCRGCRPPGEDRVNQSNESDNSKTTGYADEREDNGSSKDGVERCLGEGVMGDELVSFLDDEEDEVLGPTSCGLAVVLMLDLSRPTTLWHTMRSVLSAISKYIASRPDSEHIRNRVLDSVDKAHPDNSYFKPYCAPLIIIGGKYDIFQEFEPEQKRIICRCLRLVAHLSYGYLVFYSDLHNDLTKLALDILYHYGYGTNPPVKGVMTEHTEPLHIPPGKDKLENIRNMSDLSLTDLEDIPHVLNTYFPQEDPWGTYLKKSKKDFLLFSDPDIDAMRKDKDEELEKLIKRKEEEAAQETEGWEKEEVAINLAKQDGIRSPEESSDSDDGTTGQALKKHFTLLLPPAKQIHSLPQTPSESAEMPDSTENL